MKKIGIVTRVECGPDDYKSTYFQDSALFISKKCVEKIEADVYDRESKSILTLKSNVEKNSSYNLGEIVVFDTNQEFPKLQIKLSQEELADVSNLKSFYEYKIKKESKKILDISLIANSDDELKKKKEEYNKVSDEIKRLEEIVNGIDEALIKRESAKKLLGLKNEMLGQLKR